MSRHERRAEAKLNPSAPKKRVILSMIVKNEKEVIERCLNSIGGFIDGAAICDTGSTDGTQDIIRRWFEDRDLPLTLLEEPWEDYSTNRNRALQAARGMCDVDDFLSVMDADDVFEGNPSKGFKQSMNAEGYTIEFNMHNTSWTRPWLLRAGTPWKYYFKVHELLMRAPEGDTMDIPQLTGCKVHCNVGGEFQGVEHFREHARILEQDPDSPRSVFYLGQSYHCAGDIEQAVTAYAKRAAMGGYPEEVLVSLLRIGCLANDPGCLLQSVPLNPTRAEGLYHAARWCLNAGLKEIGLSMLQEAAKRTHPIGMFVDVTVHQWRVSALLAEVTGDKELAKKVAATPGAEYGDEIKRLLK